MEITEVRVFLRESPDKKLKAYTTVTFDDAFVVRNIKVIQGSSGLFIAMPSRKVNAKDGSGEVQHRDIAHPITQEFREYLQKRVLEAYEKEVKNAPLAAKKKADSPPAADAAETITLPPDDDISEAAEDM